MKRVMFLLASVLLIFGCEEGGKTIVQTIYSDPPVVVDPPVIDPPVIDDTVLPEGYEWQKFNDMWYSLDGCIFDGEYMACDYTILKSLKTYTNVFIFAGRHNNGWTDSIYLINCQMGYLWKFTPSVNLLDSNVKKLFVTDGKVATGINIKANIFPEIIGDDLFYTVNGIEYGYNFLTKVVTEY